MTSAAAQTALGGPEKIQHEITHQPEHVEAALCKCTEEIAHINVEVAHRCQRKHCKQHYRDELGTAAHRKPADERNIARFRNERNVPEVTAMVRRRCVRYRLTTLILKWFDASLYGC